MRTLFVFAVLFSISLSDLVAQNSIRSADTVSVKVFREPDLDTEGQVSASGTLTVPLIGPVKISGLSPKQAEAAIERKLRDGYLVRPQVTVNVVQKVARTVTVLGQVREPGVFTLPSGRRLTVVEAIGLAGGLTEIASAKKVRLKNGRTGKSQVINVRAMMQGKVKDIALSSGDVLHIPE